MNLAKRRVENKKNLRTVAEVALEHYGITNATTRLRWYIDSATR